jgi:hypothetical protein
MLEARRPGSLLESLVSTVLESFSQLTCLIAPLILKLEEVLRYE